MNTISLGVRNAFRNLVRSSAIILILGLIFGLSLVMLIAHQAVGNGINSVKSSIGNTITIQPAGFSGFSQVNNALSTSQLAKIRSLPNITNIDETLTDRLTTIGSATPSLIGQSSSSTNNETSLTSPVKIRAGVNNATGFGGGGGRIFISGGGVLPTNFSLPISIVGTNEPTELNTASLAISSGSAISGNSDSDQAMISTAMAKKNNLKVGSTFTAYGTTLTVSAIFNNSTQARNNTVIVSLPTEQRLSGQSGDITSAVATVNSIDNLSSTTTAIKNTLGSSADVTNSQTQANAAIEPLNSVETISFYSLIGSAIAGGIITLMIMIMLVRERRREIGILKAIGASNLRVIFQFMAEALTFTLLGAVVGLIIGVIGGNPVTNLLVTNNTGSSTGAPSLSTFGSGSFRGRGGGGFIAKSFGVQSISTGIHNINADIGWSILIYGLAGAILIAIIGSALAGWLIAKIRPSEVMRIE